MNDPDSARCPICRGFRTEGVTTFTADLGNGVVVVRNVPAVICDQCGEEWISPKIAEKLETIVENAREHRSQIEVLDLSA